MTMRVTIPVYEPVLLYGVEVKQGKSRPFVLVHGPNGCGKTTLLRVVMGLLKADGLPRVYIDQEESAYLPTEDEEVVRYVPQASEDALFERLSVVDNCTLLSDLLHVDSAAFLGKMQEVVGRGNHAASELSVGQKKLMVLEAVLASLPKPDEVRKPVLVLLDEPFAGLDDERRKGAVERVNEVAGAYIGKNVLFLVVDHGTVEPADPGERQVVVVRPGVSFEFVAAVELRMIGARI
jgi:energy-coupling factor transporter ATP-binding protein EcfA2